MKSLAQFEAEVNAERAKLTAKLDLVKLLPKAVLRWIGEGGFAPDGNTRLPDVGRSIEIIPWIVHDKFRGSEHVTYNVPDSYQGGEHLSSVHRQKFERDYIKAVLDVYEPYMQDVIAIKGRYASYVPESWDWENDRDYKDAAAIARGLFEVGMTVGAGYTNSDLTFYAMIGDKSVKVSIKVPFVGKLAPSPRRNQSAAITNWVFPETSKVEAENVFKRASVDRNSHGQPSGYELEWLFSSREILERQLNLI